ncbi:MAG: hypothetical protein V4710_23300 [Verrucomicrobiota bacterium]
MSETQNQPGASAPTVERYIRSLNTMQQAGVVATLLLLDREALAMAAQAAKQELEKTRASGTATQTDVEFAEMHAADLQLLVEFSTAAHDRLLSIRARRHLHTAIAMELVSDWNSALAPSK